MAKPVLLSNGRSWATQMAAKTHFKTMLNRHFDGERIIDSRDHSDLLSLLEAYDRNIESPMKKSGCGVEYFFRDRDQEHDGLTSCFFARRLDGTSIDFSYLRAVEVASKV
jgi:hypothetical protein